ncbi:hypothetical protein APH_1054 [Anaplasma phagocytophilum str. HZ]|uniref:Uncharacterized protein n=1 Tax=Anaplasma phagocytophilum (strain HZ) TaxID=212042 RepID=Q2GJ12_ANAPZ|nr:hypothetical protein APH_1091 [Anaplasma phagocytophilum str. HZ]ABD43902.1 hypothetical protein APH_1054 [Anaplasma phagocytophilum str. HZ]
MLKEKGLIRLVLQCWAVIGGQVLLLARDWDA